MIRIEERDEHAGDESTPGRTQANHAKKRGYEDTWDSTCWVAGGGARALLGYEGSLWVPLKSPIRDLIEPP